MSEEIREAVDSDFPAMLNDLAKLVAIPSVSSDPNAKDEVMASARLVESMFAGLGYETSIEQVEGEDGTLGAPAVLATGPSHPGAPTVLLYAHHDVQPVTDEAKWDSPPFEMDVRGDRIYGRGTSDDGAGIIVHLGALRALPKDLPLNIVVFIEGEEEIGSPTFAPFLKKHGELLQADVIIVADSANWTVDIPAITASLRGVVSVDVTVKVAEHAVHSGVFGGPLLDALTLTSQLIATLHDENGDVAVEGLGGVDEAEVVWDEEDFRLDTSAVDGLQLAGTGDLAARVWTKPALSVIGIDAPSVAESANAIIPEVTCRLSLRTVPGSDSRAAGEALLRHIEANRPFGAEVHATVQESGPAYVADLDSETVAMYREALTDAWGREAVATGMGASIPFIAQFEEAFPDATILVTGVEDPATNAHSENESQSVKILRNATVAEASFLKRLAKRR